MIFLLLKSTGILLVFLGTLLGYSLFWTLGSGYIYTPVVSAIQIRHGNIHVFQLMSAMAHREHAQNMNANDPVAVVRGVVQERLRSAQLRRLALDEL